MKKTDKIALTGASGFTGGHILNIFKEKGYKVYPVPRQILQDKGSLKDFMKKLKPDYVIHNASYGNHHDQTNVSEIMKVNIEYTFSLLDALKDTKCKGILYISSSSVYGKSSRPIKETDLLSGSTPYAISKIASELVCFHHSPCPYVIVRPFSIYGPNERGDRLIPMCIKSLEKTSRGKKRDGLKPMTFDHPDPVHDWLFVEDYVLALLTILKKLNSKKLGGSMINIGSGKQHKNIEVLEAVEWVTNRNVLKTSVLKARAYDTSGMWQVDMKDSTMTKLGWKPTHDLLSGIRKTVPFYDTK